MARKVLKAEKYQMPKEHLKGVARRRGEPIMYDEVKVNWNLKITPTAKKLISDAAKLGNFSASEFIERWARAAAPPARKKGKSRATSQDNTSVPRTLPKPKLKTGE